MIETWKPYIHWYKEFDSYALMFSLTTYGLSIQIGPLLAQIFWRSIFKTPKAKSWPNPSPNPF